MVGGVPKQAEKLTVEGELTRDGVWVEDERELRVWERGRRVEKGEKVWELKKREWKKLREKKVSEEVEREKARKKIESKKKWRKKMEPNVVKVFCFFLFFCCIFFDCFENIIS